MEGFHVSFRRIFKYFLSKYLFFNAKQKTHLSKCLGTAKYRRRRLRRGADEVPQSIDDEGSDEVPVAPRRILPNYGDYGALIAQWCFAQRDQQPTTNSHHGGNGAVATMITHLLLLVKVTRIDQMIALDKPEIIKKESL